MFHRNEEFTTFTALATLSLAVCHISAACYVMAESVIHIADHFHMNTFFVAVIVAAAATSVPDTLISFKSAMKGKHDDSVANAVGSNIFDICVCLGLPLFAYTLLYGPVVIPQTAGVTELRIMLLILSLLVIGILLLPKIGKWTAASFLFGYIFYASYSWCSGLGMAWTKEISEYLVMLTKFIS